MWLGSHMMGTSGSSSRVLNLQKPVCRNSKFLNEPEALEEMSQNAANFAGEDAAQTIYDEIMKDFQGSQEDKK